MLFRPRTPAASSAMTPAAAAAAPLGTTPATVLRRAIRGILAVGIVSGVVPRPAVMARTSLRAISHKISTKPLLSGPPIFVPVVILEAGDGSLNDEKGAVDPGTCPRPLRGLGPRSADVASNQPGGARDSPQSVPTTRNCTGRQPARTSQSSTVLPLR